MITLLLYAVINSAASYTVISIQKQGILEMAWVGLILAVSEPAGG